MERNFYNEEFEQFLKQKADQFKMYPSESAWKEIHRSLHPRKKWYGIGGIFLFLTAALVFINNQSILTTPSKAVKSPEKQKIQSLTVTTSGDDKSIAEKLLPGVVLLPSSVQAVKRRTDTDAEPATLAANPNMIAGSRLFSPQSSTLTTNYPLNTTRNIQLENPNEKLIQLLRSHDAREPETNLDLVEELVILPLNTSKKKQVKLSILFFTDHHLPAVGGGKANNQSKYSFSIYPNEC